MFRLQKPEKKGYDTVLLRIKRQKSAKDTPYWQELEVHPSGPEETVISALLRVNTEENLKDVQGNPVSALGVECSCLQKKCGACAMRINGKTQLACDAFLKDLGRVITVEPLKKFPLVRDLIVDRSILFANLKAVKAYTDGDMHYRESDEDDACDASLCLQCGCCLDVCPNFIPGETFVGTAGAMPLSRLLLGEENDEKQEIYRRHVYEGCARALSCADICPAGIDPEHLMVRSNAAAVFHRKRR